MRAASPLSERQQRILEFIREFSHERGYPPTVREIGQAVGISSTSVVDYNLRALRRMGYLRRDAEVSRGIGLVDLEAEQPRPTEAPARANVVPIVGTIAAGAPIEAYAEHSETIAVSPDLADDGCYALRVKGKSMIEDLIDDGDLVVIRPQQTADNGTIVVALITDSENPEGQATLKRIYRERERIRLQPANSTMEPIYVRPDALQIQGRVVAVIRQM